MAGLCLGAGVGGFLLSRQMSDDKPAATETKAAANIKAAGGTFKPFPAEELKKWKASAPDFLAVWESDTAAATKDAETPKKVAARWRQLLAQ